VTTSKIPSVLLCGVLAGVLVATAFFPGIAVAGLALKTAVNSFDRLPDDLQIPPTAQATYVYAADGKTLITEFYNENRTDVQLSEIAPVMQQAIVAAEDNRYYQHGGVDLKGIARALVANGSGGHVSQGASTLTMQYVRNVLKEDPNLTPEQRQEATADTAGRKLQEIRYATTLENKLSKQDILDRYLNISYFGDGAYGIGAASQHYFGKPPSQLSLQEAALLAGLVQSPDAYNPVTGDKKSALDRRSYVLDAMAKMGKITQADADKAKATPLELHIVTVPNNCAAVPSSHNDWGYFCDYFRDWWDAQAQFGAAPADRDQALNEGGYTIVTSLDPNIQATALKESLGVYNYGNARSAPIAVVQPGTGRVLALAVNRHYSLAANPGGKKYPNSVDPFVTGGSGANGYQFGSTFKMFTMIAALEQGKTLSTQFDAPPALKTQWRDNGPGNCDGYWCPVNANPEWMDGPRDMWTGFGRSVNTYFVWLEQQVGPDKAVAAAKQLGIQFRAKDDANRAEKSAKDWGAFTLGVASVTPLDMANAYATIGAKGMYCSPLPVVSITGPDGKPVDAGKPSCKQTISPDVAAAATSAARCPVGQNSQAGRCDGGTATQVGNTLGSRPVAGKTGSSEDNSTESFVGFTPQFAVAGIAANPDNPNDHVGSAIQANVIVAVARTIQAASKGQPVVGFPEPPPSLL
jgi:membrane peptidoglycan carboxypeptidase